MKSLLRHPLAPLIILAIVAVGLRSEYAMHHARPSMRVDLVLQFCWGVPVLIWMNDDARRRRIRPCYDFGLLLCATFPLSLLWYCFWSRGWRGLLVLLGLGALLFAPAMVAEVLSHR